MKRKTIITTLATGLALALGPLLPATAGADAPIGHGAITGRIYNPATGE